VQFGLATAQTNLSAQQEKLTNVESLVNTLFSNTEDEEFPASDTNRVIILKPGGVQQVFFKLKFAPVPNTIQVLVLSGGTQAPLLPQMMQFANILITKFFNGSDLNTASFHIRFHARPAISPTVVIGWS
jgi:hypothetical protein